MGMAFHSPITGAAQHLRAPHSNGEASAPNLPDHSHGPLANNRAATGEAGVAPFSSVSPTFHACPECEGAGFFTVGNFHPDDPRIEASWDCDVCGGSGEVESDTHCQCGEPLDDDLWCPSCAVQHRYEQGVGLVDVEMWRDENGRFGVGA